MKLSTITLALVSGASIASAERPKKNGHVVHPNDSAKPMSAVEEQGQRLLQGNKSGKSSTSSTKSSKSKSSKSASPCEMLGMGCTITVATDECTDANVGLNTAGNFTCQEGQPFVEGPGTFLLNVGPTTCLRFNDCTNSTTPITIESDILDALIEQCEDCEEVPPIDLQCTDEFLFRLEDDGSQDLGQDSALCAGLGENVANPDSFNCASGRFVVRGTTETGTARRCFQTDPEGEIVDGAVSNRQDIIDACNRCPNAPAVPTARAQPIQSASITGSELRLSTPMAATKTPNGGVAISGVTCLSASMLAVAAFGMFMF